MKVMVNGKETIIDENMTILTLLVSKEINPSIVVVEYNFEIPEREKWGSIFLKDNDSIEVVKFMGGG
jgi:sulfur carrier protein